MSKMKANFETVVASAKKTQENQKQEHILSDKIIYLFSQFEQIFKADWSQLDLRDSQIRNAYLDGWNLAVKEVSHEQLEKLSFYLSQMRRKTNMALPEAKELPLLIEKSEQYKTWTEKLLSRFKKAS